MNEGLIICSGGIDSVSMAGMYKNNNLTFMAFDYGQKGKREIEASRFFANKLNSKFIPIDISFMTDVFGNNQLCGNVEIEDQYQKSVVVPLRNAIFLQIASIYAYSNGIDFIALGSHLDDITEVEGERLYPDCSPEFFKAFELAMDLGTFRSEQRVQIISASINGMGKKNLIQKGFEVFGNDFFMTWSCYHSGVNHCGVCESCRNRKKAFLIAGIDDGTKYER